MNNKDETLDARKDPIAVLMLKPRSTSSQRTEEDHDQSRSTNLSNNESIIPCHVSRLSVIKAVTIQAAARRMNSVAEASAASVGVYIIINAYLVASR